MIRLWKVALDVRNAFARADAADAYQMHCTLARAFAADADGPPNPFLWRLEEQSGQPSLLVQSPFGANWNALAARAAGWATSVEERQFEPSEFVRPGRRFRFRLRGNPSVKREGKRHALYREAEQAEWLVRQLTRAGCDLVLHDVVASMPERIDASQRRREGKRIVVFSVLFDGVLIVRDAAPLIEAIATGIGHGKHLGLGLLSLGPS